MNLARMLAVIVVAALLTPAVWADETPERLAEVNKLVSAGEYDRAVAECDKLLAPAALEKDPELHSVYHLRGVAQFFAGRAKEAVADFDKFLARYPSRKPHHWQRGIALYYAGRYADGAAQFDEHKAVNPDDVENAFWHFLCVARAKDVAAARKGLIDVTGDPRVPMAQVQEMLAGRATPDDVMKAADVGEGEERKRNLFYGNLYVGLYLEAVGQGEKAKPHLVEAAKGYGRADYMHEVARVHAKGLK